MDQFTLQASPVTVEPPKKSHTLPIIILVLLLATLISASTTVYLLVSNKKNNATSSLPSNQTDNPFIAEVAPTNPFATEISAATVNPFADTQQSNNPFDQFALASPSASSNQNNTYQNPF